MAQHSIPNHISFNRPSFVGHEQAYIAEAIAKMHISGDGDFTRKCHSLLQDTLGVRKALLTTSCTHALEMAALLLDVGPGDEVIVPAFTFVSTVNAFALRGAKPVFADIRADTLNIDERSLESLITPKTRAIVVVHYAGVACEMDAIMDISRRWGIPVVEDNAHGLFAKYKGKYLGTFGELATQSFHETKNFTCGEGGALLISDPQYADQAEIIREKGTNRARFFRGQVDKYTWVSLGSSYLPSDILSAFLYAQLEGKAQIQARRRHIWERYNTVLTGWADANGVVRPYVPEHCEQPYHMFYMLMPDGTTRDALIAHLRERQITSVFHYLPLHLSEMGVAYGGREGDCPVTEEISERLIRLPFYNTLTEDDQSRVIGAVSSFSFRGVKHHESVTR